MIYDINARQCKLNYDNESPVRVPTRTRCHREPLRSYFIYLSNKMTADWTRQTLYKSTFSRHERCHDDEAILKILGVTELVPILGCTRFAGLIR
jgi:hypothetical protein